MAIYGLATPQIQSSLGIPENQVALVVTFFRLASFGAILLAATADLVGRRRLLLITITGQAIATLATAFSGTYEQFVLLADADARLRLCRRDALHRRHHGRDVAQRAPAAGQRARSRRWNSTGAGVACSSSRGERAALRLARDLCDRCPAALPRRLPEAPPVARDASASRPRDQTLHTMESRVGTDAGRCCAGSRSANIPGVMAAILLVVATYGFAFAPAVVLMSKYLQQVHHYTPGGRHSALRAGRASQPWSSASLRDVSAIASGGGW